MRESAGRATWGVLAFIAIAGTILSLNPVRQVTGGMATVCTNNSQCSDGNQCTTDTCLNSTVCQHTKLANNTPCDNGGEVKCNVNPATCQDVLNGTSSNCTNAPDNDGDHICNADDARPNIFDPTGYFYDEVTARIVPGGHVGVACVAGPCAGSLSVTENGSNGQYAFNVTGLGTTEETYALTITPPPGCALSAVCLSSPTALDPTGAPNPDVVGNYPDAGNPNFLTSNACTLWYTAIELQSGDPEVINNNIPLRCPPTSAPTVSMWGLAAMALLLTAVASLGLLRRNSPQA
jgi:hypothetical protein